MRYFLLIAILLLPACAAEITPPPPKKKIAYINLLSDELTVYKPSNLVGDRFFRYNTKKLGISQDILENIIKATSGTPEEIEILDSHTLSDITKGKVMTTYNVRQMISKIKNMNHYRKVYVVASQPIVFTTDDSSLSNNSYQLEGYLVRHKIYPYRTAILQGDIEIFQIENKFVTSYPLKIREYTEYGEIRTLGSQLDTKTEDYLKESFTGLLEAQISRYIY